MIYKKKSYNYCDTMVKAIITGATGMIGMALIDVLLKRDYDIIAIVRPNSKKIKNIPKSNKVKIVECDLSNLNSLSQKLTDCDVLFHFGWVGTMGSARDDTNIQLKNIEYTLDAVRLAKNSGCTTFVGAGSQAEYGLTNEKLSYSTPTNPLTGYGIAKYTAGKLSKLLSQQLEIKYCWGRILSVYGPGDNNSMIMSCINSILNDEKFDTTRGEQIWDYLYSEDCAKAFLAIAENGKNGEIYTIGSGEAIPLREYIEKIRDLINPNFEIGFGNIDYYPNQVMYLCADISKLTKDTGFSPKISFEDGIKNILKFKLNQCK